MERKIWVKIIKKWGEHAIGDIVIFDESKGRRRIIDGIGIEVSAPTIPEKGPKVETAMQEILAEKEVVTPQIKGKKGPAIRHKKGGE